MSEQERESEALRPAERSWLDHFALAVMGTYNALPHHMPPRIRQQMERCLQMDDAIRQFDAKVKCEQTYPARSLGGGNPP